MKFCLYLVMAGLIIFGTTAKTNAMNFAEGVRKIRCLQEEKNQEMLHHKMLKSLPGVTAKQQRMLNITMKRKNDQRNQEAKALMAQNALFSQKIATIIKVAQFDGDNKAKEVSKNGQITQIPCLSQTYNELLELKELGYHDDICELYAVHNAKKFDQNPKATAKELIDLLNDRNYFEKETLIPGMAKITQKFGSYTKLPAKNLNKLIASYNDTQIVVCLNNTPKTSFDFYSPDDKLKILMFTQKTKHSLTWIMQSNNDKHWFVAHIIRNAQGDLRAIIADSKVVDRCNDANVLYLMGYLK